MAPEANVSVSPLECAIAFRRRLPWFDGLGRAPSGLLGCRDVRVWPPTGLAFLTRLPDPFALCVLARRCLLHRFGFVSFVCGHARTDRCFSFSPRSSPLGNGLRHALGPCHHLNVSASAAKAGRRLLGFPTRGGNGERVRVLGHLTPAQFPSKMDCLLIARCFPFTHPFD